MSILQVRKKSRQRKNMYLKDLDSKCLEQKLCKAKEQKLEKNEGDD